MLEEKYWTHVGKAATARDKVEELLLRLVVQRKIFPQLRVAPDCRDYWREQICWLAPAKESNNEGNQFFVEVKTKVGQDLQQPTFTINVSVSVEIETEEFLFRIEYNKTNDGIATRPPEKPHRESIVDFDPNSSGYTDWYTSQFREALEWYIDRLEEYDRRKKGDKDQA